MSVNSAKKILIDIIDGIIEAKHETHEDIEKYCSEIIEKIVFYVTEEHGRDPVHLLPETFHSLNGVAEIPNVLETGVKETIQILGEMLGCSSYRTSLFEFWFLDVVADALIKSQKLGMTQGNQKILIAWFCYFMRLLENKYDYDAFNDQLERYLKLSAEFISENLGCMPSPEQVAQVIADSIIIEETNDKEQIMNEINSGKEASTQAKAIANEKISKNKTIVENKEQEMLKRDNLDALVKMATILRNIFGDELIFMMISSLFKKPPLYLDVYSLYEINIPRKMLITKTQEVSSEKDKKGKKDSTPKGKKTKREVVEDVCDLETDKEVDLRDFILPLQMAVQDTFFESLWPPGHESTTGDKKAKAKRKK